MDEFYEVSIEFKKMDINVYIYYYSIFFKSYYSINFKNK